MPMNADQPKEAERNAVVLVDIFNIRLYLPDEIHPDDEDAVRAWVQENLSRVREAAQECDPDDVMVSNAFYEAARSAQAEAGEGQ
ncbi:hypothetical protein [Deinococcus aquatilis]|uniref:hypothetical protein n=1 Tax=Deinococcus aquatilis TaxID=519440 RepID=UPI0003787F8F|nr:hypothetical protein [Deinococcus aquatilis]